jgi:hypothetical protein
VTRRRSEATVILGMIVTAVIIAGVAIWLIALITPNI